MFKRAMSKFAKFDLSVVKEVCKLIFFCIILSALLITAYSYVIKPSNDISAIAEDVTEGTVTKCIQKSDCTYLLYVDTPYIYDGDEYVIRKRYSVPEETWSNYAVGDSFDASAERYRDCSIEVSSPWDIDRIF